MTTTHSRSRSVQDPYLQPSVRQRAVSSTGTGSPHSFVSNIAVVAGPTAPSGQYYGVFLGEPQKGYPSSKHSSEQASPSHTHTTFKSTGTSAGSIYGNSTVHHSDMRSKHSSVAFPTASTSNQAVRHEAPSRSRYASGATPPYHAIRVDASTSHRASIAPPAKTSQPVVMPPSALKRERRSTLSGSSGSSAELPAADLRYLCKFAMGSISECLRRPLHSALFPRLMKTDDVLSRMHTVLYAMATDPTLLNPHDSAEITKHLKNFQSFLYKLVDARSSKQDHLVQLEGFYRTLAGYGLRLETALMIRDLEVKINDLTFQHNVSQQASVEIHEEALKLKSDRHSSRSTATRERLRKSQEELDEMHEERVTLRHKIDKTKDELWKLKQQRDLAGGAKTVRFNN